MNSHVNETSQNIESLLLSLPSSPHQAESTFHIKSENMRVEKYEKEKQKHKKMYHDSAIDPGYAH